MTTSKSPRPAGPSAQALSKLVSTPQRRPSAFAPKINFMFRATIYFRLKSNLEKPDAKHHSVVHLSQVKLPLGSVRIASHFAV
jgi:hypothetical protein